MALLSPGVQVTVTDKSIYTTASGKTIPLFFIATKYGKTQINSNQLAEGTIEAGIPRMVSSLSDSLALYGMPIFYKDVYGQQNHGDSRNEYGLLALNQFLKVGSPAYVIRADIDLDDDVENLKLIWDTTSSTVAKKAKSLFESYALSRKNDGSTSANMIPLAVSPIISSDYIDTDTGFIKATPGTGGKSIDATVQKYYNEEISKFNDINTIFEYIDMAVDEFAKTTSSFRDRYALLNNKRYNLSNILAGNFYSTEILNARDGNGQSVYLAKLYIYNDINDENDAAKNLISKNVRMISNNYEEAPWNGSETDNNYPDPSKNTGYGTDPFYGIRGKILEILNSTKVYTCATSVERYNGTTKPPTMYLKSGLECIDFKAILDINKFYGQSEKTIPRHYALGSINIYGTIKTSGGTEVGKLQYNIVPHLDATTSKTPELFEIQITDDPTLDAIKLSLTDIGKTIGTINTTIEGYTNIPTGADFSALFTTITAAITILIAAATATPPVPPTSINDVAIGKIPADEKTILMNWLTSLQSNITSISSSGTAYNQLFTSTITTIADWKKTLNGLDIMANISSYYQLLQNKINSLDAGLSSCKFTNVNPIDITLYYKDTFDNIEYCGTYNINAAEVFLPIDTSTNKELAVYYKDVLEKIKISNKGIVSSQIFTSVSNACKEYIKTKSWYNATHKTYNSNIITEVAQNGNIYTSDTTGTFTTDIQRRSEIVKKLAEIINANSNRDTNIDQEFSSDIASTDSYEYNIVLCPGYPELADELIKFSEAVSQEVFVIGDVPMDKSPVEMIKWGQQTNESAVIATGDNIRSDDRGLIAYYYPHVLCNNFGTNVVLPSSAAALVAYANSDKAGYVWSAPAGPNRGILTGTMDVSAAGYVYATSFGNTSTLGTSSVSFERVRLNQVMRDDLYSKCNINPIIDNLQYGVAVWGNKARTTVSRQMVVDGTSQTVTSSALDRVNVSRMVMYIRRGLKKLMTGFLMEQNNAKLRNQVTSAVTAYLNDIKTKNGLYDFAVLCDDSNNTSTTIDHAELFCQVALKSSRVLEFIYVPITLVKTGDAMTF